MCKIGSICSTLKRSEQLKIKFHSACEATTPMLDLSTYTLKLQ